MQTLAVSFLGVARDADGQGQDVLLVGADALEDDVEGLALVDVEAEAAAVLDVALGLEGHLGSTRVIQRRFNVSVPRARVTENTSRLQDRSER